MSLAPRYELGNWYKHCFNLFKSTNNGNKLVYKRNIAKQLFNTVESSLFMVDQCSWLSWVTLTKFAFSRTHLHTYIPIYCYLVNCNPFRPINWLLVSKYIDCCHVFIFFINCYKWHRKINLNIRCMFNKNQNMILKSYNKTIIQREILNNKQTVMK